MAGCGQSHLDTRTIIVDSDTCIQCGPHTVGEIWVSGPCVANGYWNNPAATSEVFQARLADSGEGPFLRTGDLGFLRDGELYVTGRIKDIIIVDGANHYPSDIVQTVEIAHPIIRPGCVIAFSADEAGHERLFVVAEAGTAAATEDTAKSAVSAVRKFVARDHDLRVHNVCLIQPRSIRKTSSGKLQRQACKQSFLDGPLDIIAIG